MRNPLRSEAEMFRLVVVFGLAAALVIAVTLLTSPAIGLVALGLELGVGIGLILSARRERSTDEAR